MAVDLDLMRARWDTLHSEQRYCPKYPNESVVRWRFRSFPKECAGRIRVLDVGCGAGRHAIFMAREGFDSYATDLSEAGLDAAQRRAAEEGQSITTKVAVADDLPFQEEWFDGVICFGVLNYLPPHGAKRAMGEFQRVLKPGGKLFVMLRSDDDWRVTFAKRIAPSRYEMTGLDGTPAAAEQGLVLTLFDRPGVENLLREFNGTTIDFSIGSVNGGAYVENDWLVAATR